MIIERMRALLRAVTENTRPLNMQMWSTCAFGCYTRREDLQEDFVMDEGHPLTKPRPLTRRAVHSPGGLAPIGTIVDNFGIISSHFGIGVAEAQMLFGSNGCAGATTNEEAARYVAREIKMAEDAEAIEDVIAVAPSSGLAMIMDELEQRELSLV